MNEVPQDEKDNEKSAASAASLRQILERNHNQLSSDLVARAIELLFPEFKCLRCGHEEFIVGATMGIPTFLPERRNAPHSRTDIICARCGMIESHSAGVLVETALKMKRAGEE